MTRLEINDLHVTVEGNEVLKGLNLTVNSDEVIALMGKNGSGKTTLGNVLMGHPGYEITGGSILLDGENITSLNPGERAKKGLFLSFQHPHEVKGVTISNFLRTSYNAVNDMKMNVLDFRKMLLTNMGFLGLDDKFSSRYLNEGFSGGEKKRSEMLQMMMLKPKIAIIDEADSGMDIDGLKVIAKGVDKLRKEKMGALLITHYNRILEHVKPDKVFVMADGKIVKEGGLEIVEKLEKEGYGWLG